MQRISVGADGRDNRVAPIFRLLGEGLLTPEAVDALTASLLAGQLPSVPAARLARACEIVHAEGGADPLGKALDWLGPMREAVDWPVVWRRLDAILQIDRRPWLATVGVRGATAGISRLLFAVDQYEVVIQDTCRSDHQGHEVTGQILRDGDPVPSAAILLAGPSQRAETETDAEGGFRFEGIAEGSYDLDIWAGNDLIVCTPVVLDPRQRRW